MYTLFFGGDSMNKERMKIFIYPYKSFIFLLLFFGFLQYIIPLAFPWLQKILIDDVFMGNSDFWTLNKVVICFFALYVLRMAVDYFNAITNAELSQKMTLDLRIKSFKKMQLLPKSYFDNEKTGSLSSKILYDPTDVVRLINSGVIGLLMNFVAMTFSVIIIFKISPLLTVISMVVLPLYYFVFKRVNKNVRHIWKDIAKERNVVNSNLTEKISGISVVKLFNQQKREEKEFQESIHKLRSRNLKAERMMESVQLTTESFTNLGSILIWIIGGTFVLKDSMSVGELLAFISYVAGMYGPIRRLTFINLNIQNAMSAIERIEEFLSIDIQIKDSDDAIDKKKFNGNVSFQNVSFGYENKSNKSTINNVSFSAKEGEVIAFVGESGGGKSTIFNLLTRFYEADSGEIYFDDTEIKKIKMSDLMEHIGAVMQDNFLFSGTVIENITYGNPSISIEKVIEITKSVNAHNFIMELKDGYDTLVGEKGVKLSGGQKQRIAIARTLIKNPKILLLDEATSALDTETEKIIVESLDAISKDCTTFIIAHRLSTVLRADRIYVVEKGVIVESGSHDELLALNGRYFDLYNKQFN